MLILGVYLILSPAHFLTTPDERINLRTTLSLLEGQKGAIPPIQGGFASKTGIDGREYAQYGLGVPLAYAAWCELGRWMDPSEDTSLNSLENITPGTDEGTPFLRWWMTIFTMIITALTVVFIQRILLKIGLSNPFTIPVCLLLAFGTYMMPHGRTLFTEPLTAFCLSASLFMFLKFRDDPAETKWALFAGLFWAYAVLTRLDTLITGPAAAWFILFIKKGEQFQLDFRPKAFLSFAAPFVIVFLTILLYNQFRFDSFFSSGYEDQTEGVKFATPLLVGLHGFFFTPGRSLFLYSPLLIFFPWGIMKLYKKDAWFTVGLSLLCLLYLVVMSKWQNWAGGWDWGPRHIYQITPLLFIFAAAFFDGKKVWDSFIKKAGWVVLISISVLIQIIGLSADPVKVIFGFLDQFAQRYPTEMQPVIKSMAQQYTVYLPQFSSPVLHTQEVMNNGADLLIIRFAQENPLLLSWFIIPFGFCGLGFHLLFNRKNRGAHQV